MVIFIIPYLDFFYQPLDPTIVRKHDGFCNDTLKS